MRNSKEPHGKIDDGRFSNTPGTYDHIWQLRTDVQEDFIGDNSITLRFPRFMLKPSSGAINCGRFICGSVTRGTF